MNFASCIRDFSMQGSAGLIEIRAHIYIYIYIYKEVKMNYAMNCSKDAVPDQISHCLQLSF